MNRLPSPSLGWISQQSRCEQGQSNLAMPGACRGAWSPASLATCASTRAHPETRGRVGEGHRSRPWALQPLVLGTRGDLPDYQAIFIQYLHCAHLLVNVSCSSEAGAHCHRTGGNSEATFAACNLGDLGGLLRLPPRAENACASLTLLGLCNPNEANCIPIRQIRAKRPESKVTQGWGLCSLGLPTT